jgi:hypothetical protein
MSKGFQRTAVIMMIERLTAGIDWLSMSLPADDVSAMQWVYMGHQALEEIADEGQELQSRRLLGFEGVSCGNCFVGANDHHIYMQFTGNYANHYFDRVYHPGAKVSRMDMQVTAKFDVMPRNVAKEAYREAKCASDALPDGRKRKVWIIVGSDGGDTTYIGSASSEQRARIYNKEVQSEDIEHVRSWRYEVVLKNALSTRMAREVSGRAIERPSFIKSVICTWLSERGVGIDRLGDYTGVTLPIERTLPTDIERKLTWLKTQVAPTIKYLCSRGYRDTLLLSLFPPAED